MYLARAHSHTGTGVIGRLGTSTVTIVTMATTKSVLLTILRNKLIIPLMIAFFYGWITASKKTPEFTNINSIVTLICIATVIRETISFLEGSLIFSLSDHYDDDDGNIRESRDRGECCRVCRRLEQRQTLLDLEWTGYSYRVRRLEDNMNWAHSFRADVTEIVTRIRGLNRDGGD